MSVNERDRYTGYLTTGHDWNGIKELNTKVPKLLIACLLLSFLFSFGYWYLLPAWPLGNDYTRGRLALDQKAEVQQLLAVAKEDQAEWSESFLTASYDEINDNEYLMKIVAESGPALFADNCAMCHGQTAKGSLYFPNLSDSSWLWGESPKQIEKTLKVGINAPVDGTRVASMPAFGQTGVLNSSQIVDVATYLMSLSNESIGRGSKAAETLSVSRGKGVYATNCLACHGAEATGNTALGAPNLSDSYWVYGGSKKSIIETLNNGRSGWMPAWRDRLDEAEIKILSVYVAGLSKTNTEIDASATSNN